MKNVLKNIYLTSKKYFIFNYLEFNIESNTYIEYRIVILVKYLFPYTAMDII